MTHRCRACVCVGGEAGGDKHYKNLLMNFQKVNDVFLGLKPGYQKVIDRITLEMALGMKKYLEKEVVTETVRLLRPLVAVSLLPPCSLSRARAPSSPVSLPSRHRYWLVNRTTDSPRWTMCARAVLLE